jgi:hypothetical protein
MADIEDVLNGLDDNLQPIEGAQGEQNEEGKPKTEEQGESDGSESVQNEDPTGDEETGDKTTGEENQAGDEEGYTIDEVEPETGEADPASAKEPEKPIQPQSRLTPEQQYIYENLPEIVTYGKDGKEYRVKTYTELPNDFEFASKRDEIVFQSNITAQELNARNLQTQFQSEQTARSTQEFNERENAGIRSDIAQLQKDGLLPKFKAQPDSPDFDKDPAATQSQAVLEFMNKENEKYLAEYQTGLPYRHIGFREAFYMYKAQNPDKARSTAQQEEDAARLETARRTSGARNDNAKVSQAPQQIYTSGRDLLNYVDSLED